MSSSSASSSGEHPLLASLSLLPGAEAVHAALKSRLAAGGEPREEAERYERALAERRAARRRFLRARAAWDCLAGMAAEGDMRRMERMEEEDDRPVSHDEQAILRLSEAFTLVELGDHVRLASPDGDSDLTLLGLGDVAANARLSRADRDAVCRLMEDELLGRAVDVARQIMQDGDDDEEGGGGEKIRLHSASDRFAAARRLPEMVQAEVDAARDAHDREAAGINSCKDVGSGMRAESREVERLLRWASTLRALCTEHVLGSRAQRDEEQCKYLQVKCRTLVHKIKCLELEVLASTYRPDAVQALRKVRSRLDAQLSAVKTEVAAATSALAQYEAVDGAAEDGQEDEGETLGGLAKRLAKVNAEIEEKEWALRELQQAEAKA